jgi:DNA-binding beta-propeller fold protein YncE
MGIAALPGCQPGRVLVRQMCMNAMRPIRRAAWQVLSLGVLLGGVSVAAPTAALATPRPAASVTQIWASRFTGAGGSTVATVVKVSPDAQTVYVTGGSQAELGTYEFATVAYSAATGAQLWASYYAGPGPGGFVATGLVVSPDGEKVYVTGPSGGGAVTDLDYATVAYDAATGTQLWVSRYNGPGSRGDSSQSMAISSSGRTLYVTGGSRGIGSNNDFATVAYDAATGAQLWVSRYNGPGNGRDFATHVIVNRPGTTVFVTGGSTGRHSGFDYATIAYRASDGATLWVRRYNGTADAKDYPHGLALSPDGRTVYVTGASRDRGHGVDYATIAYRASDGATLWVRRYTGPSGTDDAQAVAVGERGRLVYVSGYSQGSVSGQDYLTIAYNAATGAQVWIRRYNGTAGKTDLTRDMTVAHNGKAVYVTGLSQGADGYQYATVAYDGATGRQLWVRTYAGQMGGIPNAIAAGSDGNSVYVTGSIQGPGGYNYGTVAYRTG